MACDVVNVCIPGVTRIPVTGPKYNTLVCCTFAGQLTLPGTFGKVQHSQITGWSDFVPASFDQRIIPEFEHSTTGWISIMGPPTVHFIAGVADETWLYAIDDIADVGFDPVTGQFKVTVDFATSDGCTFYVCSYVLLWEDPPAKPPTNNCPKPMTYRRQRHPHHPFFSATVGETGLAPHLGGRMGTKGSIFGNSMQLARHHSPAEPGAKLESKPEPKAKLESKPTPKAKRRIQTEAEGRIQTEAKAEGENHRLLEKETTWLAETWERRCSSAAFRLRSRPSRDIRRKHAAWRRRSRRPWHELRRLQQSPASGCRYRARCLPQLSPQLATSPDRVSLGRP